MARVLSAYLINEGIVFEQKRITQKGKNNPICRIEGYSLLKCDSNSVTMNQPTKKELTILYTNPNRKVYGNLNRAHIIKPLGTIAYPED